MRTYNVQVRSKAGLYVSPMRASSLNEAKQLVITKEGLRPSQIVKDEAML
jgi:hypothetical protein